MDDPSTSDSPRPQSGGVPVYVMLPLDTVSREGTLRSVEQLSPRLVALRDAGVEGVMIDVWWGIVERNAPGEYDWSPYVQLMELLETLNIKLHVVRSFHACGANRDDDYHVPLPKWVEQAIERDPDGLLFQDRAGSRSDEYLSLWADNALMPMFVHNQNEDDPQGTPHPPRTPLECYRDLMFAFRERFNDKLRAEGLITEVLVGCGPCGELRYPAYAMSRGWQFPGVGEFQCYDRRALESLSQAATAVGRPEWGKGGPHDAGSYNSTPDETGFFANGRGSIFQNLPSSFAGHKFGGGSGGSSSGGQLNSSLFSSRSMMLPTTLAPESPVAGGSGSPGANANGTQNPTGWSPHARSFSAQKTKSLDDLVSEGDAPNGRWDGEYGKFFLSWYSGELVNHGERVMRAAQDAFAGCGSRLALKCAGIHWWYRTRSHAAELTTGYYNVQGGCESFGSESAPSLNLQTSGDFSNRRASMDWVPGRVNAEGGIAGVSGASNVSGFTNLSSSFSKGGLHKNASAGSFGSMNSLGGDTTTTTTGYDKIMQMAKSTGASVTFTCAEMSDREHDPKHMCGPEGLMRQVVECASRAGVPVAAENALYRCDAVAFKQMVRNCKRGGGGSSAERSEYVPNGGMTSFTFLRMCDSLFQDSNFPEFELFVSDLSGGGADGTP